jgi:hypothetical protein
VVPAAGAVALLIVGSVAAGGGSAASERGDQVVLGVGAALLGGGGLQGQLFGLRLGVGAGGLELGPQLLGAGVGLGGVLFGLEKFFPDCGEVVVRRVEQGAEPPGLLLGVLAPVGLGLQGAALFGGDAFGLPAAVFGVGGAPVRVVGVMAGLVLSP